ncbi:MAG: hypothetical protein JXR85_00900 [Deltaproteobacteria bacterium]|nr:hypothetical protein [Deltaproteobacteria bacterium]
MQVALEMKHYEEWAKDKNPLIRIASLLVATSAEPFLGFLKKIKAGKRVEGCIDIPRKDQWLNFYRNHRKVYNGVMNTLRTLDDETEQLIDFYEAMITGAHTLRQITIKEWNEMISELSPNEKHAIEDQITSEFKEMEENIIKDIIDNKKIENSNTRTERKIQQIFQSPAMIFFLRVWVPCFLLYGEYPTYLLRKARHGDNDALEKLLRLDKSIINDPKIIEIFHREAVSKKRAKIDLITKALQKTPKGKIDSKKIKYLLAGLLSSISIALGEKLTAIEIRRLFDAIAHDTTGEAIDADLIISPETFEKAIQRARTFWPAIPQADKK